MERWLTSADCTAGVLVVLGGLRAHLGRDEFLDPNLENGVREWRAGKRFIKTTDKLELELEGPDKLVGSVVTLDKCMRNFSHLTRCSLWEAIECVMCNHVEWVFAVVFRHRSGPRVRA